MDDLKRLSCMLRLYTLAPPFWSLPFRLRRSRDPDLRSRTSGISHNLTPVAVAQSGLENSQFLRHTYIHTFIYISHINDIKQYFSYLYLIMSLSIMSSRFIHVVANGKLNTTHSSTDRHLGLIPYHSYYD